MFKPFEVLGLDEDCSPDEVKRAYRDRAMELHPDRHPEELRTEKEEAMRTLNLAYERAMEKALEPKVCQGCDGRGTVEQRLGFSVVKLACPECRIGRTR